MGIVLRSPPLKHAILEKTLTLMRNAQGADGRFYKPGAEFRAGLCRFYLAWKWEFWLGSSPSKSRTQILVLTTLSLGDYFAFVEI
jgi:hypothetical protein